MYRYWCLWDVITPKYLMENTPRECQDNGLPQIIVSIHNYLRDYFVVMLPASPSLESLCGSILWRAFTSGDMAVEIAQKLGELVNELEKCVSSQHRHPTSSKYGLYVFKVGPAYTKVVERYGSDLPGWILLRIASKFSRMLQLKVPRKAQRKKAELYRWFDDHWDQIGPGMDKVVFTIRSDWSQEE